MNSLSSKRIAILGSGVIGLSTAHRLIELFQKNEKKTQLDVTIIAESFARETTSDGAGGLFRPDDRFMPGVPKDIAKKWCTDSFNYFHKLLFSEEGGNAGVFQASGYQFFNDDRVDPSYKEYIYQFRNLTSAELDTFPKKFKYGCFSTTICIDARLYMKYLTKILQSQGVKFRQAKVSTLENFVNETNYDIVFNCLGLGAQKFCNDDKIKPIRGQMIRVNAPWVKHFYYTDDNCYIIPNVNTICLGGTRQVDNYNLELNDTDSKGVYERCLELCPSLKNAQVEWEWVGLRPHREPTRVEKEILQNKQGQSKIVIHNYGHGGNGISLSRGTACHAVDLLEAQLNNDATRSKL